MDNKLVNFLSDELPFWNKISESMRQSLTKASKEVSYKAGAILYAAKEDCTGLFLITSGRIRAYIVTDEGKEVTLFRLLERDLCIFSASCMMKNINFDIYVSAETDVDTILIPAKNYMELSEKEIHISNFTNEILSSRMSDVMWILEQILFFSFDKRLALFLEEQSNLDNSNILKITHEQIANHLGSAREVVSRMLKYFEDEGFIQLGRGSIQIIDSKKLNYFTLR